MNENKTNSELFYNALLPLTSIETDPKNPRKLAITLQDIKEGFSRNDPNCSRKETELQKLREVANTINKSGILNPIIVYKDADKYRIVAGERRYLASFISGAKEIEVRVYYSKPSGFDLKLAQWVENTAREDLSLMERLDNIRDMINEYLKQFPHAMINATWLREKTCLSLPQATYYINVLNAPKDVIEAIQRGYISSLDKAAIINSVDNLKQREQAIKACKDGMSLKKLRDIVNDFKQGKTAKITDVNLIQLGATPNHKVLEFIVNSIVQQSEFQFLAQEFANCRWDKAKEASKAFKKLITLLEERIA
jgi:ParB family chromosome partitioning protein